MSEQESRKFAFNAMNRRSLLQSTASLLSVPFTISTTGAFAQEKLSGAGEVVVYSYGGSFTEGLRKNVFERFTKSTGIKVVDVTADLAEPQIKAMREAGRVDWDVAFVTGANYPALHEAGAFLPIDYDLWNAEALIGVPESARRADAVLGYQNANLLVYDERAFPKAGPKSWADFWNVKEFPGPRGLDAGLGYRNMVYALMADGVARSDIFPLTDDKIDRALKKLDEIKPHIVKWWTAGGEPVQLLLSREYALTSAPDGRAITAIKQGAPLRLVWEGANMGENYWTILKGGPNSANGQKFLAFVNRAEVAADFTQGVGYPGPNTNQLKYLPANLLPLLSINPDNAAKVVPPDFAWFTLKRPDGKTNADHMQERWLTWRAHS
ncbi:ABC transporter substrate-binding protein [Bradyrhizobium sp. NBAIM01]|uniref:ABC transporter substrate-binding protein n=1 Tax=Bradyrhizobium sp. NBAIM01 TaxID=2793818 RepID=UPI001CD2B32A|nr:ABC transporter substrate-binding protein [Bradyrhizobium sp. NBAIM01]MCA1510407.1 ABC transporter substrate-binding protein [Bradyrhizobium sp. NBAIM01]